MERIRTRRASQAMVKQVFLLDLPLEVLTNVCQHPDLCDLIRVGETCKHFGYGGQELVKPPGEPPVEPLSESPLVTVLRERAFPGGQPVSFMRPSDCSESWVAYLARRVRQRRCWDAPTIAAAGRRSILVDASDRLLQCGGCTEGAEFNCWHPIPAAVMAGLRVRSVATGRFHSLVLCWNDRVYSWGSSPNGELGHSDRDDRVLPALVEGLESVRGIAAADEGSLAVTHSGFVFCWGDPWFDGAAGASPRGPTIVDGLGATRVRCVCAKSSVAFAIGEDAEIFSWGKDRCDRLCHGDEIDEQSKPKRVEALHGVKVGSVAIGCAHVLALTEDGAVYAWGRNTRRAVLGNRQLAIEPLP